MKRIGILGGMSSESTAEFYTQLVQLSSKKNKHTLPEILIFSVDFKRIIKLQKSKDEKGYIKELMKGISALQEAKADFIVIPSNTPHIVFGKLQKKSKIPLLSIVKSTALEAKKCKIKKTLLLGTKFTMQSTFYQEEFQKMGIEVITPEKKDQVIISKLIYQEFVKGKFTKEARKQVINIIKRHAVDGIILGCTELPLIIQQKDSKAILFDTLKIHAKATISYALK